MRPRLRRFQHVPGSLGIVSSPFSNPRENVSSNRDHEGRPLTREVQSSPMVVVAEASSRFRLFRSLGAEMVSWENE